MMETNNVEEKNEKLTNSVELSADNTTKDVGKSVPNTFVTDVDNKPNGKEEHGEESPTEEKTEGAAQEEHEVHQGPEPVADEVDDVAVEKSVGTNLAAPVIPKEKSKSPAPTEETTKPPEEEQEEKTSASPKAKGGRGRPKKAGKGAASKVDAESGKTPAPADTPADEEIGVQPAAEKAQPAKRGRKRGAASSGEGSSTKAPKTDEDGPSGTQENADEEISKKTPLFENPLVVEGKRQRQKVDRLDSKLLATPTHTKEAVDVPQGCGTKLGDIPYVDALLTKTRPDDLKPLHRLLFGRVGTAHEIRKHLRAFSGFDFEKGSEPYTRKWKLLDKWTTKQLKETCEVLGLERSGKKEDLQTLIMDFILKPADTGRKIPQSKKGKSNSGGGKKRGRGRPKKGGSEHASASESDEGGHTEESGKAEEEEEEEDNAEESEPEAPKAKRAKKAPEKKESAASTSKKGPRGKAAKTVKNSPPTDDDLKAAIQELLQGANLEEITMRDMCRKVFAKYPSFDLTTRKDFIKDTVKSVISSSAE